MTGISQSPPEVDLVMYKNRGSLGLWQKKSKERRALGRKLLAAASPMPLILSDHAPIMCFHCGQEGSDMSSTNPSDGFHGPDPLEAEEAVEEGEGGILSSNPGR